MSYDSNVFALQNTVNRFAAVARFQPLSPDGFWGTLSEQATRATLGWISRGSCTDDACVEDGEAAAATGLLAQWTGSPSAAKGLTVFIGQAADELGLPAIAAPIVSRATAAGSAAANMIAPLDMPSWASRILDAWKSLATWQKIGLGVLFGFGAMWIHRRVKARS
jgi:hypothetical protein